MPDSAATPITYKDAGVDIEAGDEMVRRIRHLVERTHTPRVLDGYGGFAGAFSLDFPQKLLKQHYRDPVLVACTDGVGTKSKIAVAMDKLDTVGIDCVAMCANDLICAGAEPLLFLDYIGTERLAPDRMAAIVKGVADGCVQAGAALLGGETAEMPDVYAGGDFDLVGFCVGVVERRRLVDPMRRVEAGDVVLALGSDGLHANGFGLARRVLLGSGALRLEDRPPELEGRSVGEEMLRPTRIYVRSVLNVLKVYRVKKVVKAMAHITGGGLPGNLPRVLPEGLTVRIRRDAWPVPPIFKLIADTGPVDQIEMMRVFNMGVGFVLIVSPHFVRPITHRLRRAGERVWRLGKVRKGGPEITWA